MASDRQEGRGGWAGTWRLLSDTVDGFNKDRGDLAAAALAYNTLLSIAPLLLVAVAIAGAVLGTGPARAEMTRILHDTMGPSAASAVEGWVEQAAAGGTLATAIGALLSLWAASRLATQLRNALNLVFNVAVKDSAGLRSAVAEYARGRAFALLVVLAGGPLLTTVFASRALLTGFHRLLFAGSPWAGVLVQALHISVGVLLVGAVCAAVFRFVPDAPVDARSAWQGGLATSLLFNVGNVLVGLYLGRASVSAAYGAAGSAIVLLLWLQFSAYLFLLGAEFTQRLTERPPCQSSPRPLRRLLHIARGPT